MDTFSNKNLFYSYRRSTLNNEEEIMVGVFPSY